MSVGRQRVVGMPWSHIKLIALALLLTVLAHDAVMAGNPHHGTTQTVEHHAAAAMNAAPMEMPGAMAEAAPDGPALNAASETPCGATVAVRPGSGSDLLLNREAGALIRPMTADAALVLPPVHGEEPAHPPDVRRALLQVFLN